MQAAATLSTRGSGQRILRRRRIDPCEARALSQTSGHHEARVSLEEDRLKRRELVPRGVLKGGQLVVLQLPGLEDLPQRTHDSRSTPQQHSATAPPGRRGAPAQAR